MKKLLLISLLAGISPVTVASHSAHYWQKIAETKGNIGRTVCTWECNMSLPSHYTTTAGHGGWCPIP